MKRFLAVLMILAFPVAVAGCSVDETVPAKNKKAQSNKNGKKNASNKKNQKKSGARKSSSQPQVKAMLTKLVVADEVTSEYDRDYFKHWSDLDGDGCDARDEVLTRENRKPTGAACDAESGLWFSPYDGEQTTDPSGFDVDHMVPLSEAWDSGAHKWNDDRREQYANDLHPYSLIAVSASSNRSKSDQDPAEWMPTSTGFTCQYTARWIAVKFRWRLAVDSAEKNALSSLVAGCSNKDLKLTTKIPVTGKPKSNPSKKPGNKNTTSKKTNKSPKPKKSLSGKTKDPLFSSCAKATDKGYGPYRRSDPEYSNYRDADSDGIVCEF